VTPGMFERSSAWWQNRTLADPDWRRGSGGELQCAILEDEGRPAAYALYRMNWALERGLQSGAVAVIEALAESPQATGAIWRYLLDIDWMARVRASLLPLDHPLLLLLAEPRRLGFGLRDGVWVRLIDARAALSARSYRRKGLWSSRWPMNFSRGMPAVGGLVATASTAPTAPRPCVATSVRSARSTSAALPGPGSRVRCGFRNWSRVRLRMRTQSSRQRARRGVRRSSDS
jgi:Acetyltransferase (GNAT) domain